MHFLGSYTSINVKPKINTRVHTVISSADGSDLGPLEIALCFVKYGLCELSHNLIVCENLSHAVILDLDFAKYCRGEIDWNC